MLGVRGLLALAPPGTIPRDQGLEIDLTALAFTLGMRSLDSPFLDRLTLTPAHGSTLRALGEHRGEQELHRQQIPEALETLRTVAMVESTESSNRLEGVVARPDRLREVVG